eukprot:1052838-Amphidinium_carterae.1
MEFRARPSCRHFEVDAENGTVRSLTQACKVSAKMVEALGSISVLAQQRGWVVQKCCWLQQSWHGSSLLALTGSSCF